VVLSDETLLAGMAGGDQGAASAFVRRYQARVYGLALTIVDARADAEEVSQEVFLKAWRYAATYDPRRGRVSTWLLTITRNAAVDAVRYRHEDPMDPDVLLAMLAPRDTSHEDDPDTSLTLRQALAELPPEQRRPILMMAFQGLTAQEIAVRNGVPLGTVKTRVRRGLRRLRGKLGVEND
jgi:RNA polymerase sigma factor (sigma-70 family)